MHSIERVVMHSIERVVMHSIERGSTLYIYTVVCPCTYVYMSMLAASMRMDS